MPKAWGPIGFCTFKAFRQQPDVAQPPFTTATYFSSCVVRVYLIMSYIESPAMHGDPTEDHLM